jgi:hypothetical protein
MVSRGSNFVSPASSITQKCMSADSRPEPQPRVSLSVRLCGRLGNDVELFSKLSLQLGKRLRLHLFHVVRPGGSRSQLPEVQRSVRELEAQLEKRKT